MRKMFIVLIHAWLTSPPMISAAEQPYFHGKTVTLQVGAPAGGRQDRIARTMAKYFSKYTPGNPAFLIQNKTGGQGIPAMLALSKGPTDGSFMSTVISSYLEAPYFGAPGATYDREASSTLAVRARANSETFFFSSTSRNQNVGRCKKPGSDPRLPGSRQPKLSLLPADDRA